MKIIVCMKQVPDGNAARLDPDTGTIIRSSAASRTNPYDLFALEEALLLKEKTGAEVTVLTMGPEESEAMMRDAYSMGADSAVILSDMKFAGSDVLATAFTLSQGITVLGGADLIICGRQTTDGDTAQVGPALAEYLHIPHAAWISEVADITEDHIDIRQEVGSLTQVLRMSFPCLITVESNINVPRLPSYKLSMATSSKPVRFLTFKDLPEQDLSKYGLLGSPTNVIKMFAPKPAKKNIIIEGADGREKAKEIFKVLSDRKII